MDPMQMAQIAQVGVSSLLSGLQLMAEVKKLTGSEPIVSLFDWNGSEIKLVHGDEQIEIETSLEGQVAGVTWFFVKEKDDYTYLRFPVIESPVQELLATLKGEDSPDTRYWRSTARPQQGAIVSGDFPTVKLQFVVIGYKPKELIDSIAS